MIAAPLIMGFLTVEMNAAPVEIVFHDCLREKFNAFQCPFFVLGKACAVNDITDVLFAAWSIR